MDADRRAELIATYRSGVADVDAALAGATDAELDARPSDDEWSPRMVVHHLADSETNSYLRMRKLLAEEDPQLQGYDEGAYAQRLHYDRPIEASLAVFRAVRRSSAELLDTLSEADWDRAGTHSESGSYSMTDWLRIYAAHGADHAAQIRRARGLA